MRHTPDTPPASANGPPALPGPSHIKDSINPPAPPPPNRCPWTGPSRRAERPPRKNSWHPLWAPICCAVAAGGGGHPFWDGCCVAPPPPPCMCIYIYIGAGSTTATLDLAGLTWRCTWPPLPLPLRPWPLPEPLPRPPICCAVAAEEGAREPGSRARRPGGRADSCGDERERGRSLKRFDSGSFERFHSGSLGIAQQVSLSAGNCCSCCTVGGELLQLPQLWPEGEIALRRCSRRRGSLPRFR